MATAWTVRTFPCEGGWYWQVFRDGEKVNGGIAPDADSAEYLGWQCVGRDQAAAEGRVRLAEFLATARQSRLPGA